MSRAAVGDTRWISGFMAEYPLLLSLFLKTAEEATFFEAVNET